MSRINLKNNTLLGNEQGVLLPAPRKSRPNRRERFWLVQCNFCGESRWLRKHDMLKDAPCRSCSATITSTIESNLEVEVEHLLNAHNVTYVKHVPFINDEVRYNIDFWLPLHNLYIEVKGYWHDITKHTKDLTLAKFVKVVFVETLSEVIELLSNLGVCNYDD